MRRQTISKMSAAQRTLRLYLKESASNRRKASVHGVSRAIHARQVTPERATEICKLLGINPEGYNAKQADTESLRAEINRLNEVIAQLKAAEDRKEPSKQEDNGEGTITINVTMDSVLKTTVLKGIRHPKFTALLNVVKSRMGSGFVPNIMLVGPTSTGKSHAAEAIASALGLNFHLASMMGQAYEVMGYNTANGTYVTTEFRKCFEFGGVMLLDEVDSWDANAVLALNGALANTWAAFPDGMVKRHPNCIIIAAGNTWGHGATTEFNGRTKLDAAFLSRFPVKLDWYRDNAMETAIGGNPEFAARVQRARAKAKEKALGINIDTRHVQAGAALIAAGFSHDEAAKMTYLAGLTLAQVAMIEAA